MLDEMLRQSRIVNSLQTRVLAPSSLLLPHRARGNAGVRRSIGFQEMPRCSPVTVQSLPGAKSLPEPQERLVDRRPSCGGDLALLERFGHFLPEVIHLLNGLLYVPVLVELAEDLIDLVTDFLAAAARDLARLDPVVHRRHHEHGGLLHRRSGGLLRRSLLGRGRAARRRRRGCVGSAVRTLAGERRDEHDDAEKARGAIRIAGDTLRARLTRSSTGSRRVGSRGTRSIGTVRVAPVCLMAGSRDVRTSAPLCGRSAGSFSSRAATSSSNGAGTDGSMERTRGAGVCACAYDSALRSPSNGGRPTSISNCTQPSE